MKSLIVGMGIGKLYRDIFASMGADIVTVDLNGTADYTSVHAAIDAHGAFDTVNICTPNFTHEQIARAVAPHARIVFVEKPGVKDADSWAALVEQYPNTRIMMVKNNQYRDNIEELQTHAATASEIQLNWINNNRVPSPGTWFTTKSLAYGGVSRDLLPHLLSIMIALEPNWRIALNVYRNSKKRYTLKDVANTDYGTVNVNGIYDVDDYATLQYITPSGVDFTLTADWKSSTPDNRSIWIKKSGTFELGLCPESAYKKMIETAIAAVDDDEFWQTQLEQDFWIHAQIGSL
jgi:predicted dehydrogenase